MFPNVKAEPVEVVLPPRKKLKLEAPPEDNDFPVPNGRRPEALILEVVVPTLASVKLKWRAEKSLRLAKTQSTVKVKGKLKGVKPKKCAGDIPSLSLDTINARLDKLGPPSERDYQVDFDNSMKFTAVPRAFISNIWGGSAQATYPKPSDEKIAIHGLNDFLCPNTIYNPNCPQIPGVAGLLYYPDGLHNPPFEESEAESYRTITRDKYLAIWTYQGQYIEVWAPSLTRNEWLEQAAKVKNTWAKEIWRKGWGLWVRVRVTLRKQLKRDPYHAEFQAALKSEKDYRDITPDDIKAAYDSGQELLGVRILKCIGYDEDFQRAIHTQFPAWVPPPPKPKGQRRKTNQAATGQKRKRVEVEVEEIIPELSDEEDLEVDDEDDEGAAIRAIKRGTVRRPRQ